MKTIPNGNIVIENEQFCLTLREDCIVESLIYKPKNIECISKGDECALFSLTEERPYNNEIKLAHPNKKTTFEANSVRIEDGKLVVGFELVTFKASVIVKEEKNYITFKLEDFILKYEDFAYLAMTPPPVCEFRLIQLPIMNREKFGEWLNVSWDDEVAVNVLATSPYAYIDSERRKGYRIMSADALAGIKLKGCEAALIVSSPDELMNAIEDIENDYDLPKGVASRRNKKINASAYWTGDITPLTVDKHIAYAKKGGFSMMLIYYPSIFVRGNGYGTCGNYDFREEYPNGAEDLKKMLDKIKAAGITPGFHFLQTHIGIESRYVTPVADHRLNLTRHFTLSKAIGTDDTEIYVEQNPEGSVMHPKCRMLMFGGEIIYYDSYTTESPYCFKGCKRGHLNTNIKPHDIGTIGGILDVSEFSATSIYLDQNSSLQDEIADKLAIAYNAGFEFVYFDGSEGAQPPFGFHIPNAQYRVYKKFNKAPIYCEGAAKAHFSWHMLSGGNAFDTFTMDIFKQNIARFPAEEAPRMQQDFTRLNFGWWAFYDDTMPDHYEYGTSLAAAWDCPVSMMARDGAVFETNPRTDDVFEVMRRWEEMRDKGLITDEMKAELKNSAQEHILIINENNEYELCAYDKIEGTADGLSAFIFTRKNKNYVVCWHTLGEGKLKVNVSNAVYENEPGHDKIDYEQADDGIIIPVAGRRYLSTDMTREALADAFKKAEFIG